MVYATEIENPNKLNSDDLVIVYVYNFQQMVETTTSDFSRFIGQTGSGKSHESEMNPYVRTLAEIFCERSSTRCLTKLDNGWEVVLLHPLKRCRRSA